MLLDYVPLLAKQRELQGMPRDYARFQQYVRTIIGEGPTLELPTLGIMNPMGKEHVTELLDTLLAMNAEGLAEQTMAEAAKDVADVPGDFKMGLVVADDLKGGWTNRWDYEFNLRFGQPAAALNREELPKWLKHRWLTAILWSSEPASEKAVREAVLTVIYRAAYVQRHGYPRTLRQMMKQEGDILRQAGCTAPMLDEDDLAYTREILAPLLDQEIDKPTAIECLFGDPAGKTLGFSPRGLSLWAGLALGLHDASRER